MKTISFAQNWNQKLYCDSFTTFRMWNAQKYQVGEVYEITCQTMCFEARLLAMETLQLSETTDWMTQLDAGCSKSEFDQLVREMYQGIIQDFEAQTFVLLLLGKV